MAASKEACSTTVVEQWKRELTAPCSLCVYCWVLAKGEQAMQRLQDYCQHCPGKHTRAADFSTDQHTMCSAQMLTHRGAEAFL